MLRRWGVTLGFVVLAVGAWAACVGGDPDIAPLRGAQGQACFENGTCLSTLLCQGGICDVDRDGAASTSSSSTSSGSTGGISPLNCGDLSTSQVTACFSANQDLPCGSDAPDCCPGRGCQAKGGTCPNAGVWECFSNDQCKPPGAACCVVGTNPVFPHNCGNPRKLAVSSPAVCKAGGQCGAGEVALCNQQNDCPSDHECIGTLLELKGPDDTAYRKVVRACVKRPVLLTDSGADANGTSGSCTTLPTGAGLQCPVAAVTDGECAAGTKCCPGEGCVPGSCAGSPPNAIGCFSNEQCTLSGQRHCCILGSAQAGSPVCSGVPQTFTRSTSTPNARPQCFSACDGTSVELCVAGAQSPCVLPKTCKPIAMDIVGAGGPFRRVVGACLD